jgi:NAD(P)-dependent dehydrogenase (short-subunit alcohol dehydrogenase family)
LGIAAERFGRIDTLINNAGVFIAKPFTVPDFPLPLGELGPLRAAAEQKGSRDFTPPWSGQAAALSREMPAAIKALVT